MPFLDQILLEAHQLERSDYAAMAARIFAELAKTHALVHVHANNGGIPLIIDGSVIGSVLELT